MGLIISRFRRKKTTTERLEILQKSIRSIEQDGQYKERAYKKIIGHMMAYSVGIYLFLILYYYFIHRNTSEHWLYSLLYASPLLVLPVLVIFLRYTVSWYYNWWLNRNRIKLNKMKEEKKNILEDVMNTETYKVAKEILDKYGTPEEQSKAMKPFVPTLNVPGNPPTSPIPATPGQLKQRQLALTSTPINRNMNMIALNNTAPSKLPRLRSEQLPRPLLDNNRTVLEKVVDYILKDGPSQRMALVCTECFSHNGMALFEEFEYVSYTCAYCGKLNPARKQKPIAPALTSRLLPRPPAIALTGNGDESSVPSSGTDSGEEENNQLSNNTESGYAERPPSPPSTPPPEEEMTKSPTEKKEA